MNMKTECLIIFSLICITNGMKNYLNFLNDFFREKPCTITIHVCWPYDEISEFFQMNLNSSPKQIAFYKNSTDYFDFFHQLSTDNFFVLDLENCENSWTILQKFNDTYEFRFPLKILLLITEELFEEKLLQKLANFTIFPTTELVIAKMASEEEFALLQPYKTDRLSEIIFENYGSWNSSKFTENFKHLPTSKRRTNLRRAKLDIVLLMDHEDTWNHLEDFKQPRLDTFTKQNYGAIKALMDYCYIDFGIRTSPIWGYYNATSKSWNGLVSLISNHEAQISGTSPYFTKNRFKVVDFIKMQNPLEIRFIMRRPSLSYMHNVFTLPFSSNVWRALGLLLITCLLTIYITYSYETRQFPILYRNRKFHPSDGILILLEAVCQQGNMIEPRTTPSRILILFIFVSFMFLYCSYSAFIIVLLQSTHTITSYQELVDSSMAVGAMDTSYMRVYLQDARLKVLSDLYKKKIGPNGYYALDVGMAKVKRGSFAFHCEIAAAYDYIAEKFTDFEICNLQVMTGFNEYMKGYTMIPKHSPYKEIFKVGLLKIDEFGLQRRNHDRFIRHPKCYSGGGGSFQSVGIIEGYNAILLWVCGCALAVMILLLEIAVDKRRVWMEEQELEHRRMRMKEALMKNEF